MEIPKPPVSLPSRVLVKDSDRKSEIPEFVSPFFPSTCSDVQRIKQTVGEVTGEPSAGYQSDANRDPRLMTPE